jgi:hypothetical protein
MLLIDGTEQARGVLRSAFFCAEQYNQVGTEDAPIDDSRAGSAKGATR